jgi:hypothetical protein
MARNLRPLANLVAALLFSSLFWWPTDGLLAAREIGPAADLCGAINSLQPGEILTLAPGDYHGPCRIRRGGTPSMSIVIQGQSSREKPQIIYDGQDNNVFEIAADFVTLRGLKIGPTKRNVAGMRILARAGITIEDCEFSQLGGVAIAATRTSVEGLYVRRNTVTNVNATAMYFGCHDGVECQISNLFVERNFISGVNAPDPEVGYGVQFKLNSSGVISDNVIVNTKGPGIMVYGSSDASSASVVERNFVSGSRQSVGILVGGGPAHVRNNIVRHNSLGGVALQDYGNRGLLTKIALFNNTSVKNGPGEFVLPSDVSVSQTLFALNAAVSSEGGQALPRPRAGLDLRENIDCTAKACFANLSLLNFSPLPNAPLSRVRKVQDAQIPLDDYFGRSRHGRITAGAVVFAGPSIRFGIKFER